MDGVIRTKKYTTHVKPSGHFVMGKREEKNVSVQDSPTYRVYQLGKSYEAYDDCIGSDVRDGCPMTYDARTMLMKKEGDFVFSGGSSLPHDTVDIADEEMDWAEEGDFAYDDIKEQARFRLKDIPVFVHESVLHPRHISFRYTVIMGCVVVSIGFFVFIGTVYAVREHVNDATQQAIISIKAAMGSIAQNDFSSSGEELDRAYQDFAFASSEMGKINMLAKYIAQYVPGASRLASGDHIIEAGKFLTHTAKELHSIIPEVITDDHKLVSPDGKHVSFLALYQLLADRMDIARYDLAEAQKHIDQVYIDDMPEKYRDTFVQMKTILPEINTSLRLITESRPTVEDMLGANGPRTYLLLFQNNNEMRATGGFIGSYGIVKINNGRITQMMIDDVYNPDGQLIDRVVPPLPIQKISANWSMHDSNWFPNFPTSAKKTMDFYERSGGATVDGVIAITPELMKKLLEITGPVTVDGYDVTLTSDNFVQILQGEIEDESNYVSKTEESLVKNDNNKGEKKEDDDAKKPKKEKPKKILSDLVPIMIDRLFDRKSPEHLAMVARVVSESLKERHIMIYMTKPEAQKIIENNGWGGVVVDTNRDYLSVVNTNINGFKTDGVITEMISHNAVIDQDGAIVDTVQIKRQHIGGHTGYPWWDAVNADYMRLYVPKGSELISVEGQTREINEERLAYDALGYEHDRDVKEEEQNMHIDEETGTRIYEQSDKTVFANWVYVSPQESVTVTYVYRLPFHVDMAEDDEGKFGSYAVLFQKQSGSVNSSIESTMALDKSFTPVWQAHDQGDGIMKDALTTDRYNGVVFRVE